MPSPNHSTLSHISHLGAYLLLMFLVLALPSRVRADELTGAPYDDPKDLSPAPIRSASSQSTGGTLFLSMPSWSRGSVMPPLPDQLKPMGKRPVVAVASTTSATPASSLTPPKDVTSATPTKEDATAQSKPAPAAPEIPALVAVSPFLQWIKANPQAAAAQARQEANSYHAQSAPPPPNGQNGSTGDPYWLPPLIDSPDIVPGAVGGSAAIYSTPQR